jgi:glycosyltransferase involved in cell wall biosynthesis
LEPLVSVICITRNHERFCVESLDSILNQTYKNLEWIILDAASTDNTPNIIDNWLVQNNVKALFIKEKELKPITVNLNNALSYAKGDFIQFISLDDLILPNKITTQLLLFNKYEYLDLVSSKAEMINIEGIPIGMYQENLDLQNLVTPNLFIVEIRKNCIILLQSCLIKKSIFQTVGEFDEKLQIEDWDWLIRFSNISKGLIFQNEITVKYRILNSSLWNNKNFKLFKSHFQIIKKHKLYEKENLKNHLDMFLNHSNCDFVFKIKIFFYLFLNLSNFYLLIYLLSRYNLFFKTLFKYFNKK